MVTRLGRTPGCSTCGAMRPQRSIGVRSEGYTSDELATAHVPRCAADNKEEANKTPPAFRDMLLGLARASTGQKRLGFPERPRNRKRDREALSTLADTVSFAPAKPDDGRCGDPQDG